MILGILALWVGIALVFGATQHLFNPIMATWKEDFKHGFTFVMGLPFILIAGLFFALYWVFFKIAQFICREFNR